MDEGTISAAVKRCARFIMYCGDSRGVSENVLVERVSAFADLDNEERFRVMILTCKEPGIAFQSVPDGTSRGSFRFWPRCYAPLDATTYRNAKAP